MEINHTPIDGSEPDMDVATLRGALGFFYRAFNSRSLEMMRESWENSSDIVMDNPIGGITRGWEQIERMYQRLFSGPARIHVEFHDYSLHVGQEVAYAVGHERGSARLGEEELSLAIRTTRIFRLESGIWRQVHHHGSIEDARLLGAYQAAVLKRTQP